MNLISPEEFKKNRKVRIEPPATQTGGLNLISPNEFKAEQERKKVEKLQSMGEEFKQIGKTIASPFTGLIQALKTDKQRPVQMVQPPTVPSIRSQINAAHVNSLENFKQAWPTQSDGLVDRSPYLERVKQKASEWPELLKPVGLAVEGLAQAPFMLATREALGTTRSEEEGFKPVTGAGRVAGDILASVGTALTMPGAGLPGTGLAGGAMYNQAGHIITRAAPRLGTTAGGRTAETAIKSAAEGVPLNVATELALNPEASGRELALAAGVGGVGGAALGGIGRGIGEAYKAARELGYDLPALLEGRGRTLSQAAARDASRRAYGIYPESLPDVRRNVITRAEPPSRLSEAVETEPPGKTNQSWFERLFGSQGVGITPGARGDRELIDAHIVSRATRAGSILDRSKNVVSKISQNVVDRFAPFTKINQKAYDAAMDSTRGNNLANITIYDKFVDLEGNVIGKSLKDVYRTVPRGKKHLADRYLVLRDSVNRMDRNIWVYGDEPWFPQTPAEAERMVRELEARNPWLINFGQDWNQFNRNRQDLWVQSGIASQELVDTLRRTNPNYTPMFRQKDDASLGKKLAFNTGKAGFSGQKAPVKRAVGSSKKIIEPAQGMIETTGSSYNAMLRNRAMQEIYSAVEKDPSRYKGIIEIVEETSDMKQSALKKINEAIEENGVEGVVDLLNDEMSGIFKKASQTTGKNESIVTVMINGQPVKMRVYEPSLLKAIEGISPDQLSAITKVFDTISRGIKYSATGGLAPLQGLKLYFRDLPIAFMQSKNKKMFLLDLSHAIVSQIGDWLPNFIPGTERLGNLARQYYRAGGGYEAYLKGDSRLRRASSELTRDPLLSGRGLMSAARQLNPFRPLNNFANAMENVPRIAAFNDYMRRTGWDRSPENVRKAMEYAREATVNWSRRGYRSSEIEAFLPYSNAAVQGTYRLVKRFREQPVSAMALIMGLAAAKIAAHEQFKNDPDYQYRSKFVNEIPISKTKDGKFNTIPVEQTEAFIADQILEFWKWANGEQRKGLKESIQDGAEALLPKYVAGPIAAFTSEGKAVDIPSAIATTVGGSAFEPISASVTGKNYFGGDIVPREYQGLPKNMQYNETTSAAGKWAAENIGMDAFTFDYLGQKFGGDLAKVGLPMTSEVGKGDPLGNIQDEVLSRLRLLEDPVMKNRISQEYYDLANKVSQAWEVSKHRGTPPPPWYNAAYNQVTGTNKNSLSSRISELNRLKKSIQRDTTLSARERSDQIRELQTQINLLRIKGIERLRELGVK